MTGLVVALLAIERISMSAERISTSAERIALMSKSGSEDDREAILKTRNISKAATQGAVEGARNGFYWFYPDK